MGTARARLVSGGWIFRRGGSGWGGSGRSDPVAVWAGVSRLDGLPHPPS